MWKFLSHLFSKSPPAHSLEFRQAASRSKAIAQQREWLTRHHQKRLENLRNCMALTEADTQRGFSLIELMVVLAIVSILSTLAFYAYSNYSTRTAAAEGIQLADGMKTAVAEAFESTGAMPTNNAAAGLVAPVGKYVDPSLSGVLNGTIEIVYLPTAPGALAGTMVALTPYAVNGGGIAWTCGLGTPPAGDASDTWTLLPGTPASAAVTTTPPQFLPAACRVNG
jgi:type IV pilus assembly protein PilA